MSGVVQKVVSVHRASNFTLVPKQSKCARLTFDIDLYDTLLKLNLAERVLWSKVFVDTSY